MKLHIIYNVKQFQLVVFGKVKWRGFSGKHVSAPRKIGPYAYDDNRDGFSNCDVFSHHSTTLWTVKRACFLSLITLRN